MMSLEITDEFGRVGVEAVLLHMDDSVAIVDRDRRILLTNRAEELSAAPSAVRMSDLGEVFEIFRPDGARYETEEWPVLRSLRTGEVIVDEEFFRLAPDGSRRSFSCSAAPFYDEKGEIVAAWVIAREITERKRTREQLAYLLPMLDHTEDAIIAFDPEWRVNAWNRGAERMYGWTAGEVLGRVLLSFMRVNLDDEEMLEIRRETAERGRRRGEVVVERKDGSVVSVEAISVTIRDDAGRITGFLAIHRDITERARAEAALREAQRRSETVLESFSDIFFVVDRDWRYTYVNERAVEQARRVWGRDVTVEELLGRNCWELLPEHLGTAFGRELHRAMRERREVEFETYSSPTGDWVEVRAYPSEDGLSVHSRDITERKRTEEELAYYASLLENMHDAVLATDAELVLTAWNRGAERMFGWTAADALGQKVYELIPTDWTDAELASRQRRLAEDRQARTEGRWYGKGRNPVLAESVTIPLRSEDGQITGYLAIMRDISSLRRSEVELELRLRQQAGVAQFGLKALADGHLQPLMDTAVTLVCRTLGVKYAKVDELVPSREELLVRAGAGWGEGIVGSYRMPADRLASPAGYALASGDPVIVNDVATETRFEIPELLPEHGVVSDITVVIDPGGNPFGTLAASSTKPRAFSDHDVSFVQSVANVIAAAAARARADERIEAAREAERTRIARDLHDEALRELTDGLALATVGRSGSADEQDQRRWDAVISALQRTAQQLRGAIYDLRLSGDDERPYGDLLSELVALQADMPGDTRIQLHAREVLGAVSLGHAGAEVLRIVTEALTNSRRHSGATTIIVDVGASTADVLRLEVSDDGAWPDRESAVRRRAGTGVASMFHRAEALGAKLRIESRTGGGTSVSLELELATPRPAG